MRDAGLPPGIWTAAHGHRDVEAPRPLRPRRNGDKQARADRVAYRRVDPVGRVPPPDSPGFAEDAHTEVRATHQLADVPAILEARDGASCPRFLGSPISADTARGGA